MDKDPISLRMVKYLLPMTSEMAFLETFPWEFLTCTKEIPNIVWKAWHFPSRVIWKWAGHSWNLVMVPCERELVLILTPLPTNSQMEQVLWTSFSSSVKCVLNMIFKILFRSLRLWSKCWYASRIFLDTENPMVLKILWVFFKVRLISSHSLGGRVERK